MSALHESAIAWLQNNPSGSYRACAEALGCSRGSVLVAVQKAVYAGQIAPRPPGRPGRQANGTALDQLHRDRERYLTVISHAEDAARRLPKVEAAIAALEAMDDD